MPATRRPTARRRLAAAVALPLLAAVITSCGYGSAAKNDDTRPAVSVAPGAKKLSADSVKIGYFPNLTHATALVGVQQGFFQKELGATKVEPATFNAGPSEIEALNAGSVDIGFVGPSPAVNGYTATGGKSLRIIAGSASGGVKLVVNPKKIKSLADVKGKRIATPQLGNTQDVAFLNWLAEQGWKVDAQSGKGDVSVIRTDNKITPDAYTSGSIDGAWVPEPTASKLVAKGAKELLDESDIWPDKKFVITNIVVSQTFLKEHPDVVEAVLRGSVATDKWINANEDKAKASANAALKRLSGAALPPRGPGPGVEVHPDHRRPAGRHAADAGRPRGQGRAAEEARPEGHLRSAAARQGARGAGPAERGRRRSRGRVTAPFTALFTHCSLHPALFIHRNRSRSQEVTTMASTAPTLAKAATHTPAVDHAARIAHVSKSFATPAGQQLVLDDITLDVAPGEFVTLLGASGCGKSTLLNLVAGLDRPTGGSIETPGGRPALMFQEHALFPWLTAGKNIELALRLRGVPKMERRDEAERLLELVRLRGAHGKRVHELSGGMRQRVALARALAQDSSLLLMDEPFAALDAITRDVLHDELTRIWRETELSVVFVTHNVREAVRLAERVVLLSSRPGRVAREWHVGIGQPRRIEDPEVAELSVEITEELRGEIRRHGQH